MLWFLLLLFLFGFASPLISTMFQQTVKNFTINFNALNQLSSFTSGDLITGQISFELTKETKVTSITMELRGKAKVHWSTGGGGKRNRRRHHHAKLDFFRLQSVILQENSGMRAHMPFGCMPTVQAVNLCWVTWLSSVPFAAVGGTPQLQPGTHVYPFSCQIPQGCVWALYIFVTLLVVVLCRSDINVNKVVAMFEDLHVYTLQWCKQHVGSVKLTLMTKPRVKFTCFYSTMMRG